MADALNAQSSSVEIKCAESYRAAVSSLSKTNIPDNDVIEARELVRQLIGGRHSGTRRERLGDEVRPGLAPVAGPGLDNLVTGARVTFRTPFRSCCCSAAWRASGVASPSTTCAFLAAAAAGATALAFLRV